MGKVHLARTPAHLWSLQHTICLPECHHHLNTCYSGTDLMGYKGLRLPPSFTCQSSLVSCDDDMQVWLQGDLCASFAFSLRLSDMYLSQRRILGRFLFTHSWQASMTWHSVFRVWVMHGTVKYRLRLNSCPETASMSTETAQWLVHLCLMATVGFACQQQHKSKQAVCLSNSPVGGRYGSFMINHGASKGLQPASAHQCCIKGTLC